MAALVPFVRAWSLPLNPENLDLLAYAILRHARSSLPLEEVRESVQRLIHEDTAAHNGMLAAMRAHEPESGSSE